MVKSLAQLKRDAKEGVLEAEMLIRCGNREIPERLRGRRPIIGANSNSIMFRNSDGEESLLYVDRASLVEYTEDRLTTYLPGLRPPTAEEQEVLDEWKKIEQSADFQERSRVDALTDGSSTYWQQKAFFEQSKCPYMYGKELLKNGCYYNRYGKDVGFVTDYSIRGEIVMQYAIYRNEKATF